MNGKPRKPGPAKSMETVYHEFQPGKCRLDSRHHPRLRHGITTAQPGDPADYRKDFGRGRQLTPRDDFPGEQAEGSFKFDVPRQSA
jgi:hypothetical protein